MKQLFLFALLLLLLCGFSNKTAEGFYDITFLDLSGEERSMYHFEGQKLLLVVVPGQVRQEDTILLQRLNELSLIYNGRFKTIAVPSMEDGFVPSAALVQWYQTYLGAEVLVTEGMNTEPTTEQSPLFSWLTTAAANGSFNQPVSGVGQGYFITGEGRLVAVLDKKTSLTDSCINRMLVLE